MTRENFIQIYGATDACCCKNCEEYFLPSEAKSVREPHGEYTPICPYCECDDIRYFDEYDMRDESEDYEE